MEEQPADTQDIVEKITLYALHIYIGAREKGGEHRVKKYSRKLRRISLQLQELKSEEGI
jgi:hypothetical protein